MTDYLELICGPCSANPKKSLTVAWFLSVVSTWCGEIHEWSLSFRFVSTCLLLPFPCAGTSHHNFHYSLHSCVEGIERQHGGWILHRLDIDLMYNTVSRWNPCHEEGEQGHSSIVATQMIAPSGSNLEYICWYCELQYQTNISIGFLLGCTVMMSQQSLVLFAIFAGINDNNHAMSANRAAAAFLFFLFIIYVRRWREKRPIY